MPWWACEVCNSSLFVFTRHSFLLQKCFFLFAAQLRFRQKQQRRQCQSSEEGWSERPSEGAMKKRCHLKTHSASTIASSSELESRRTSNSRLIWNPSSAECRQKDHLSEKRGKSGSIFVCDFAFLCLGFV
jgi:hypothetical protein